MKYVTTIGEKEYIVEILDDHHVVIDGTVYEIDFDSVSEQPVYSLLVDGKSYESYVYTMDDHLVVLLHGRFYPVTIEDEREKRLRMTSEVTLASGVEYPLKAPMPGLVVDVPVQDGQKVKKGEVLVILESMKMQNELKSPKEGVVGRIRVKRGDSVEQHQVLMRVV